MSKIPVGLGSLVGLIGASATAVIPLVGQLADATSPLGVPPFVWVTVSATLAGLVVIGRMAQAVAGILKGSSGS